MVMVLLFLLLQAAAAATPTARDPVLGPLRGVAVHGGAVDAFLGIPYAEPPERFAPAVPWSQPLPPNRSWDTFGDDCWQGGVPADPWHAPQSENCLFVNVWRPSSSNNNSRAVMVWIHGGGFQAGASSERWYHGERLAAAEDVVVVSLNYRLGALGFFASDRLINATYGQGSGALNGVLDQIVALRWVQQHIATFGGDPARVTVFGQSAGGESVCVLALSPQARGLFARAIVQSGPCAHSYWAPNPHALALNLSAQIMAVNNAPTLAALRALPVDNISWPGAASESAFFNGYFSPDGHVLPRSPQEILEDPNTVLNAAEIVVGTTSMDGTLTFVYPGLRVPLTWFHYKHAIKKLYGGVPDKIPPLFPPAPPWEAVLAQYSLDRFNTTTFNGASYGYIRSDADRALVCPTKKIATAFANRGATVFHYFFDYDETVGICDPTHTVNPIAPRDEPTWWASHGTENHLIFATTIGPDGISPAPPETQHCPLENGGDLALSQALQRRWGAFARTGAPGADWPAVRPTDTGTTLRTMRLGTTMSVVQGLREGDCAFWDKWNTRKLSDSLEK